MASVAGDYYDFLGCGEKGVAILIADVSGHGVPAAIIASMIKVALAAQESSATDPATVLRNMNHIFCGKLGREFITAAYAYIDIDNRMVVYSGAGHLPLLLFQRASNSIAELHARGLFLGKMPEASYINERIPYSKGDRLFLFTDGIVEARNREGAEFGDHTFREFIIGQKDIPLELLADRLLARLTEWTGKKGAEALDDDVTLVVAEFDNS